MMIFVITVVKMLRTHGVQASESGVNFDHCDDEFVVDKTTDHAGLMQAALCLLLLTAANWPIRLQHYCQLW